MVSVILGLLAIICGGASYPVGQQSHTLGLVLGAAGLVLAVVGFTMSFKPSTSNKDNTNKKEGMWLSIAGGVLSLVVVAILFLAK